ncbi:MAG TPA: hypothetical protein PLA96_05360, partial [Candidatus Brocadia sapporoensis]|nr:hypothetical protein [Candidatus Brocadia sapporoensis]
LTSDYVFWYRVARINSFIHACSNTRIGTNDKTWTNRVCPCHPETRVCASFLNFEMVWCELAR